MSPEFKMNIVANIIGAIATVILFLALEKLRGWKFDAPGLR